MKKIIVALSIDENEGEEYTFEEYSNIITEAIMCDTTATVRSCVILKKYGKRETE